MGIWEYIINSAIMGSDKPAPGKPDLPEELTVVFNLIEDNDTLDRETRLLQQAAVVYNYRKSGFVPLQKTEVQVSHADEETLPYCSDQDMLVLRALLNEDNLQLLEMWMQRCSDSGQLIQPDLLPDLLTKAEQYLSLRKLAVTCSGNRGQWLSRFNEHWNYFAPVLTDEEIWLTGKPEERIGLLKRIRKTEPERARDMVIQTWPEENAAQKLELLKTIRINSSVADLQWLEGLSAEKGQKVKDEVLSLLRQIPGSAVIQQYETLLSQAVVLKKEKALLGMLTKVSIHFSLPELVDDRIYKSGIEKLAGPKSKFNDEEYVIFQLMEFVPPVFWERHFGISPEQVMEYFEKYAEKFVIALGLAVARFKQYNWVPYFMRQQIFYPGLIDLIKTEEQEKYLLKFIHVLPQEVLQVAVLRKEEFSMDFAMAAFKIMVDDSYRYNSTFYSRYIHLIPVGMINKLGIFAPKEAGLETVWQRNRDHVLKLLILKQQIPEVFNAKIP